MISASRFVETFVFGEGGSKLRLKNEVNLFDLEVSKLDLEDHLVGRSMIFIFICKYAPPFARRRWIIIFRIKLLLPCVQDKD
jgi:hypothetical protein